MDGLAYNNGPPPVGNTGNPPTNINPVANQVSGLAYNNGPRPAANTGNLPANANPLANQMNGYNT
jgi:hypothetical protein